MEGHPYLPRTLPEQAHVLSKAGRAACEKDADLAPGHGCCAVCAGEGELLCPGCNQVRYCASEHMERDKPNHGQVCSLLACVGAAEGIDVTAALAPLFDRITATVQDVAAAGDWTDILPPDILPGASSKGTDQDTDGAANEEDRPVKKARHQPPSPTKQAAVDTPPAEIDVPPASATAEISAADPPRASPTASAPPTAPAVPAAPDLHAAVLVGAATAVLTYPCSLARALSTLPGLQAAVTAAQAAGRPLVVTVLGPAADAELAHLRVWRVLEGLCPAGVQLQMVGPDVPGHRHMQATWVSPSVCATFFKGEYSALVDHVLVAAQPLTTLPPLSPVPAPPKPSSPRSPRSPRRAGSPPSTPTGRGGHKGTQGAKSRFAPPSPPHAPASPVGTPASPSPALPAGLRALPDVVVGFNMGLTCPDYSWASSLTALRRVFKAKCAAAAAVPVPAEEGSKRLARRVVRLPWLHTSNTQVEALLEEEVVRGGGWGVTAPPARNPLPSLEPLQSGTLSNDLYRKNAWWATYELTALVAPATSVPAAQHGSRAQPTGARGMGMGRVARAVLGGVRSLAAGLRAWLPGGQAAGKRKREDAGPSGAHGAAPARADGAGPSGVASPH